MARIPGRWSSGPRASPAPAASMACALAASPSARWSARDGGAPPALEDLPAQRSPAVAGGGAVAREAVDDPPGGARAVGGGRLDRAEPDRVPAAEGRPVARAPPGGSSTASRATAPPPALAVERCA